MENLKKISALILIISIHFSTIYSQSLIKAIHGDLYERENGIEENLISKNTLELHGSLINYELDNNNKYYFSTQNGHVIIDLNSEKSKEDIILRASDFPKGFSIDQMIFDTSSENTNSNYFIGLWNTLTEDVFKNKVDINHLYTTDFQGVERNLSSESKSPKVLPSHYIAIDLKTELFLFEDCSENIIHRQISDNSRIFIESPCDSLFIREASIDEYILCVQEPLTNDHATHLETLFSNISDDIDKQISQYLVVRIMLENKYIYNSRYYINLYDDNTMIQDYMNYMEYQ